MSRPDISKTVLIPTRKIATIKPTPKIPESEPAHETVQDKVEAEKRRAHMQCSLMHHLVLLTRRDDIEEIYQFLLRPVMIYDTRAQQENRYMFELNNDQTFSYKNSTRSQLGKNINKLFKLLNIRTEEQLYQKLQLYFQDLENFTPENIFEPVRIPPEKAADAIYEPFKYEPRPRQKVHRPTYAKRINADPMDYLQFRALGCKDLKECTASRALIKYVYITKSYGYDIPKVYIGIITSAKDHNDELRLCHDKLVYYHTKGSIAKYLQHRGPGKYSTDYKMVRVERDGRSFYLINR